VSRQRDEVVLVIQKVWRMGCETSSLYSPSQSQTLDTKVRRVGCEASSLYSPSQSQTLDTLAFAV
jgi:hypothetical protein